MAWGAGLAAQESTAPANSNDPYRLSAEKSGEESKVDGFIASSPAKFYSKASFGATKPGERKRSPRGQKCGAGPACKFARMHGNREFCRLVGMTERSSAGILVHYETRRNGSAA